MMMDPPWDAEESWEGGPSMTCLIPNPAGFDSLVLDACLEATSSRSTESDAVADYSCEERKYTEIQLYIENRIRLLVLLMLYHSY
jgi:hypothetical protein